MNKFKPQVNVAVLLLRLAVGIPVLIDLFSGFKFVSSSLTFGFLPSIVSVIIFGICPLFILLGLWSRWASLVIVLFYVIFYIAAGAFTARVFESFYSLFATLATYIAILLIGSGKYSLDQKFFKKIK